MMERKAVKLITAQDSVQADMILETLKDHQIPAYKQDLENAGLLNLYGGNSFFGADIYVAEEDVKKAAEVLEGIGLEP